MNRKKSFPAVVAALLVFISNSSSVSSQGLLKTTFFPEPLVSKPVEEEPAGGSSAEGKLFVRDSLGNLVIPERQSAFAPPRQSLGPDRTLAVGSDVYLQDGSEVSLAVNYDDGNNLTGVYNQYWGFDPSIPHGNSTDGNLTWTSRVFPAGSGSFTGYPFDPWANPGNTAGEFFSTLIRYNSTFDSTRCIVTRSVDGGASFSLFYQELNANSAYPIQDKEGVDIDRTAARGGGPGTAYDGRVYLCYDIYTTGFGAYGGTFFQAVSRTGLALQEISLVGGWPQPVAGVTDGTVYVKSGSRGGGSTMTVRFHEITNGGAGPNTFTKSTFSYTRVGQLLPPENRPCINGHRIDPVGYLDIDRSSGSRRGYLYYVSNRNPNLGNATLDQGDVYISLSTDGAASWSSAAIPTAAGKTQYFPMLDVDEQGWIHVAYYQNEAGSVDGGVLNASTANLYYTLSLDGGTSWIPPVQVNDPANALDYEDPPPDRGSSKYLIGDYQSIQAAGSGISTKVYVLWSGYDKDRSGCCVGDAKTRVWCTTVPSLPQCQGDATPPTIACQADIIDTVVIFDPQPCSVTVNYTASVQDNCPIPSVLVCNPPSGSAFPVGTTAVACSATDASGNADSCNFSVTVRAIIGDLNSDGERTPADAVLELNCVFLASGSCSLCLTDFNGDGELTPADAVLALSCVFLGVCPSVL